MNSFPNQHKSPNKIAFTAFVLLSLFSVVFIIFSIQKNKNDFPSNISPSPTPSLKDILPGKSTEDDVIKTLGKPISINGNLQNYKSKSPTEDNQISYQSGFVDFTKEIIGYTEKRNPDEITTKYGVSQNMLYGPDSVNGYYLFVYPTGGIAYLGNPITKSLLEIWRFIPTDINTLINNWAQNYSIEQPPAKF